MRFSKSQKHWIGLAITGLFVLGALKIAISAFWTIAGVVLVFFLIFYPGQTFFVLGGGALMWLLKKVPDSITVTVLAMAGIFYFVRWMRSEDNSKLSGAEAEPPAIGNDKPAQADEQPPNN